jgi:hypothetical protein
MTDSPVTAGLTREQQRALLSMLQQVAGQDATSGCR